MRPLRPGLLTTPAVVRAPNARRQAEALVVDVQKRKGRIASDFYEIGVDLKKLSEPRLYRALGYQTFDDLLRAKQLCSRIQAWKLIEVVEAFPKAQAIKLGVEMAHAVVRYAAATPAPDVARALARSNARVEGRKIRELTVRELQAATRRVRAGGPASDEGGKEARKVARQVQKSLRAKGAKQAKVRARQTRGRWWLDLELPLENADVIG